MIMDDFEQSRIFDRWLQKHSGLLFKVVRAYAFNPADQEDLFQEIAGQVWKSILKFRGDSAETTWLYRVALYTAIDWTNKEKKHRAATRPIDGLEHTLAQSSKSRNNRLDWLYERISEFDEIDRSLTLMMLDGFSYREISGTLGISESNVGVKLNRIKKRLTEKASEEQYHGL